MIRGHEAFRAGDINYTGGISKTGDRRVRTLLHEAANVMLARRLERKETKTSSPSGAVGIGDRAGSVAAGDLIGRLRFATKAPQTQLTP
jgi:hypothetical protein